MRPARRGRLQGAVETRRTPARRVGMSPSLTSARAHRGRHPRLPPPRLPPSGGGRGLAAAWSSISGTTGPPVHHAGPLRGDRSRTRIQGTSGTCATPPAAPARARSTRPGSTGPRRRAPLPSGPTEVVVATAREDPLRQAFAWVTLVGDGPAPTPADGRTPAAHQPLLPARVDNAYMDASNTMRSSGRRRATPRTPGRVAGGQRPAAGRRPRVPLPGAGTVPRRRHGPGPHPGPAGRLRRRPGLQLNYDWPGI